MVEFVSRFNVGVELVASPKSSAAPLAVVATSSFVATPYRLGSATIASADFLIVGVRGGERGRGFELVAGFVIDSRSSRFETSAFCCASGLFR